jgi:hypothetical protein
MTRTCTICTHPDLEEIDKQLLIDRSYRDIAGQFGTSKSSLERHHKGGHISEVLVKAQGAKEEIRGDKLLDDLKSVRTKTEELLNKAEKAGEIRAWPAFLREMREQIKLMGELEGKLASQPQINFNQVNIYQSPEWSKVGELLAEVLADYPELRRVVSGRLLELARGGR